MRNAYVRFEIFMVIVKSGAMDIVSLIPQMDIGKSINIQRSDGKKLSIVP